MSVKNEEIETYFGRCRCCLSYGYLKNMWSEHKFEGETIIYGEMLVQCFALSWESPEDMEQDQICERCIHRLRDASDFKKVVLDSQEELLQQIDAENIATFKEEPVDEEYLVYKDPKSEPDTMDTEYTIDAAESAESTRDEAEYEEIEFLEEEDAGDANEVVVTDSSLPVDQPKRRKRPVQSTQPDTEEGITKRKWPKKLPKAERYKSYKQYTEEDMRKCMEAIRKGELTPNEAAVKYNIPKKTISSKMKIEPKDAQSILITEENGDGNNIALDSELSITRKNKIIVRKFKKNVRIILEYSNATPIRGHWGIGYACGFCNYQSPTPAELKEHTLSQHSEDVNEANNVRCVSDMIIKLDITDLKCSLCNKKMDDLEHIMEHLKYVHNQPMHFDISNHIVPFKFDTEFLTCALCSQQFTYFKHVSEHMNEHYPNYECPECGRNFINKRSLKTHAHRHRTGVFVCSHCSKVFDTRIKMKEHERVLHVRGSKTRKCGYCDEKFMDPVRKTDHEVKEHGAPVRQFECKACGKWFDSQRSLKGHTDHFHLLRRPHICPDCGNGFFTKNQLKKHRVKHTGIKEFQCVICSKWYGTRYSLKIHRRIHDNERPYSCERCGQAFVQKCSWALHMKKHACD